jgi:hypothetical protein
MSIGIEALRRRVEELERRSVGPREIGEAIRMLRAEGREHKNPVAAERARDYWRRVDGHFARQDQEAEAALATSAVDEFDAIQQQKEQP